MSDCLDYIKDGRSDEMTVQELIDELIKIDDKTQEVVINDHFTVSEVVNFESARVFIL